MKSHNTDLPKVKRFTRETHHDARGFFREMFHTSAFAAQGFTQPLVQWNHSRSLPGVIRGIHFQHAPMQGKLVSVTHGAVLDVAVDLRPHSPRFGQHVAVELSAENGDMLWVPPGFGHGFCVLGDGVADVVYGMSAHYAPGGESGVAYDDSTLAIAWPVTAPVISARDALLPTLHEATANLVKWFGEKV